MVNEKGLVTRVPTPQEISKSPEDVDYGAWIDPKNPILEKMRDVFRPVLIEMSRLNDKGIGMAVLGSVSLLYHLHTFKERSAGTGVDFFEFLLTKINIGDVDLYFDTKEISRVAETLNELAAEVDWQVRTPERSRLLHDPNLPDPDFPGTVMRSTDWGTHIPIKHQIASNGETENLDLMTNPAMMVGTELVKMMSVTKKKEKGPNGEQLIKITEYFTSQEIYELFQQIWDVPNELLPIFKKIVECDDISFTSRVKYPHVIAFKEGVYPVSTPKEFLKDEVHISQEMKVMTASLFMNIKRYGNHVRAIQYSEENNLVPDKKLGSLDKNQMRVISLLYILGCEYLISKPDQAAEVAPLFTWLKEFALKVLPANMTNQSTA